MINSKEIQSFIMKHWFDKHHCLYVCSNFSGAGYAEADVLAVNRSDYAIEFEIKMSRSDYWNDFKKPKHALFKGQDLEGNLGFLSSKLPNKFYFCCPEGVIKEADVPEYAGLIHFKKFRYMDMPEGKWLINFTIVKKAPYIHKQKVEHSLVARIAQTLSARFIFGCALMTYKNRQNKVPL